MKRRKKITFSLENDILQNNNTTIMSYDYQYFNFVTGKLRTNDVQQYLSTLDHIIITKLPDLFRIVPNSLISTASNRWGMT